MTNRKKKVPKTTFLLPPVSFLTGVGSVFNVVGNFYTFKTSSSEMEADRRAIQSDWDVIGKDMEIALDECK